MRVSNQRRAGEGWRPSGRHLVRERTPAPVRGTRQPRRWDRISWRTSLLLFFVPLALLVASVLLRGTSSASPAVVLRVTDRLTNEPLAGVRVVAGGQTLTSDEEGVVRLAGVSEPAVLTVEHANYESMHGRLGAEHDGEQTLALRPTTLEGTVVDAQSGAPLAGRLVSVVSAAGEGPTATTGPDGVYRLADVPADAKVRVDGGDYGVVEEPIGERTRADFSLKLSIVTGMVTDAAGAPLAGATITTAAAETVSGPDGAYKLTGAADATEVVVAASGYTEQRLPVTAGQAPTAVLEPIEIKALHLSQSLIGEPGAIDELIAIADRTEINALVIDVKEDLIFYDTQVPFFRGIDGMVAPIFDPAELLARLDEHDIYAIARMVVFKDPRVAEARPDLAVTDDVTGQSWRDYQGVAWVNAFNQELWHANSDLAVELATIGFDEVQYDYIRFPSDGDLSTANFGPDYSQEARRAAIRGVLELSRDKLRPTGVPFAADFFGIIALFDDDQGIGQYFEDIAPLVDYVCLMAYPSHYEFGNITNDAGEPLEPNDYPYETIRETLERAQARMPEASRLKQRPWIQDFFEYEYDQVRAQIRAAEEFGTSGWMVWGRAREAMYEAQASAAAPRSAYMAVVPSGSVVVTRKRYLRRHGDGR